MSSHIPDDASSMSDDVFEDPETTQRRIEETRRRNDYANTDFNLTRDSAFSDGLSTDYSHSHSQQTSSAGSLAALSGYPGYRPHREALQLYAFEDVGYQHDSNYDDGWRSYRYDEVGMYSQPPQPPFDDTVNHKTILLGDSGVGKTSFLVKYNTGEFRLGSFSATVGIALTSSKTKMRRNSSVRNRGNGNAKLSHAAATYSPQNAGSGSGSGGAAPNTASAGVSPAAFAHGARRESLIKPTWQHITPGQIPPKTLDKINGITSDDSDDDNDYPRRTSCVIVHQYTNTTNSNIHGAISRQNSIATAALAATTTRAYGLVVHNDGPSTSKAVANGASGAGGGAAAVATATDADTGICKNAGRALIRMLSTKVSNDSVNEDDYDVLGKVIMLGDSGVGKTCLLIRFRDGKYMPNYFITTVGIDFRNKVVVVDGTRVKLQIWDTAGQERFRSVTHAYYRDAHALLLLYDVTNKTTYDNIRAWLGEIREYAQDDVVIVLIGNKADCGSSERQVKREDGERLAREHNVPFMETSAKTGLNVELAFAAVARQLKCRGNENGDDGKFNVHDFVRDNTKARTICAQCKAM